LNQIQVQPLAVLDVEESAIWYEAQEIDLGLEFILEIDAAIDYAVEAPKHYEEIYFGVRRFLLKRFPYAVYFLFENNTIEIIAVLHQHQSPTTWQSRI